MTDLVGADLQLESGSSVTEATPASNLPAEPGFQRDALGNEYAVPRQGTGQGGTDAQRDGTQGASSATVGSDTSGAQLQPTPPPVDPTIMRAAQAAMQRAEQAEARVAQWEQAQWEAQVRQLPPDQQRVAIAQRRAELTAAQAQQAARAQAQQQQALEPLFKEIVVTKLAQQYAHAGVSTQMLQRFNSPEAMEEFCRVWASDRRVTANAQRTAAGVDRAASAGSASRSAPQSWRGSSLREQLSAAFE